jgi:hypothetical protein
MSEGPDRRGEPLADVEIGAAARAKRLRFNRKPEVEVAYRGDSDSRTERENLPDEVEPGVTYRDVEIRWVGGARIEVAANRRVLDRALGRDSG